VDLMIASVFGALPLMFLPVPFALSGLFAAFLSAALAVVAARRLLGGYTGDVLGAVEQIFEIAFLLGAAACA
jgi:adenosylcobinamide-GDP ribazoletransferase